MLPKDLLEVRKIRGRIYPRFASASDVELAEIVMDVFRMHLGRRYGDAMEQLKSLENASNYRKVRGFAKVLERFCRFDICTSVDPIKLRMFLFSRGFVTKEEEREKILMHAAEKFRTTIDEIEHAMFADMEEEMIISHINKINASDLIKFYNLSLLQTALFDSLRMTFWTGSNYKDIFRRIKWLGLMYDIYEAEESDAARIMKIGGGSDEHILLVEITGAASILKMTRKYGTAMAKLIPSVLSANAWWIRAEILDASRIYMMEIDSSRAFLFPRNEEHISYDSSLEEEFARNIRAINRSYEVIREPAIVKAGKHAFIPDFAVRIRSDKCGDGSDGGNDSNDSNDSDMRGHHHNNRAAHRQGEDRAESEREVYIEIVGFWTPEYLRSKVEKVRNASVPLIIIAREEYGRFDMVSDDVVLFSSKIPYNEVARRIEQKLRAEPHIVTDEDVVNLRHIADVYLINIKDVMEKAKKCGYSVIGYYAVRKNIIESVKSDIDALKEPKRLAEVSAVLSRYGLSPDILPEMGYKICWSGLNFDDAVVKHCDEKNYENYENPIKQRRKKRIRRHCTDGTLSQWIS